MVSSFRITILPFLLVAISSVSAAPWARIDHTRHATHRLRHINEGLTLESYHPRGSFKTFGSASFAAPQAQAPSTSTSFSGSSSAPFSLNDSAIAFIQSQLGIDPTLIGYRAGYSWDSRKYAYVRQRHKGILISNAVANIAWLNDKIVAFGSSFINASDVQFAPHIPTFTLESIVPDLETQLDSKLHSHPPSLEYLIRPDNSVALTHVAQFHNPKNHTWVEAFICAHTKKLLSVTDFVAHATYTVVPINKQGLPDGLVTLEDPSDKESSPLGWHTDAGGGMPRTDGNNVFAFGPSNHSAPISTTRYNVSLDPSDPSNLNASITNAFYVANMVHDIAYKYGFIETAFNFQQDNLHHGGKGGDKVYLSVQDSGGLNNANFATPPDGQSGLCRMYIWDSTKIRRDGAMENDIVVHEMTHGITNRMTGGGSGRCLQTLEAGGLGEGWSDAMAEWVVQKSDKVEDFVMGQYVLGSKKGIRQYPYSTDPAINPLRYSNLRTLNEVHAIGEVWANMLHNVYAALVADHGFSPTALTDPTGEKGNVVFMHLMISALPLQPCNPTFVSARDAWIQADLNRYKGANRCTLYKAFASRGLGYKAQNDFVDNENVPPECSRS